MASVEYLGLRREAATRIIVEKDVNVIGVNSERHTAFQMQGLTAGRHRPDGVRDYYGLSNLAHTSAVEFVIRKGRQVERVELPDTMLSRIAEYHRNFLSKREEFDCRAFVYYVNNVPYDPDVLDLGLWKYSALTRVEDLKPGTTAAIFRYDENQGVPRIDFRHFGIYLKSGLFLSKFGRSGPLIVTDLDEMAKCYQGNGAMQLTPALHKDELH